MWIEVDAANKGRFGVRASVDEPDFLMLTEAWMRTIPSDASLVVVPSQQFEVRRRAPECIALQCLRLGVGSPKDDPYINAASRGTIEHLQGRASFAGHPKFRPHEGDGRPHAVTRRLDGLAYAAVSRLAIDQRPHEVAAACRIGARCHERQ